MNTTRRRQIDFGGARKATDAKAAFMRTVRCLCGHQEQGHDGNGCLVGPPGQPCACLEFQASCDPAIGAAVKPRGHPELEPPPDPKRAMRLLREADDSRPGTDLR